MIFGLVTETRNDPEYVRNIAFWVRRLFDLTTIPIETLSTDTTLRLTRYVYVVDTSAGIVTVTLPPAKDAKGEWIKIKNLNGTHKVTIDGNGAETIDGDPSVDINSAKACVEVVSDGTQWYVTQP